MANGRSAVGVQLATEPISGVPSRATAAMARPCVDKTVSRAREQ